jgi:hypothetical protein
VKQLALIAGLGAILVSAAIAAESEQERLDAARALWAAAQQGDYRYGYQKYCDCHREDPPLTVVTVRDGRIERVYHLHSDSPREVPAREGSLDLYWTIDDLFDKIAGAIEAGAELRVDYDQSAGYPASLYIDYDAALIGDEVDLRLTRFETIG